MKIFQELLLNEAKSRQFFAVRMPYAWDKRLVKALEKIKLYVVHAERGATDVLAIALYDGNKKLTEKELNDNLRKAIGSSSSEDEPRGSAGAGVYQHWLSIKEMTEDQADKYL